MKNRLVIIVIMLFTGASFAQQIGDGYAPAVINDFSAPLKSGIYNGYNGSLTGFPGPTNGVTPDVSNPWQHLFAMRHLGTNNNYQLQIASSFVVNDRLFFRKIVGGDLSAVNTAWIEIATRGKNSFTGNQIINGNVGIGNSDPLAKLDISGDLILRNYGNFNGKGNTISFTAYGNDLQGPQIRSYLTFASGVNSRMGLMFSSYSKGYMNELFLIDGKVGIGTINPNNKLDVNGTIHSKEVKVDMEGWSDFVFKKEYNLPSLAEIEKHINEKGHLENIPSEKEVLENGINLGEMNAKLLQKIEELTLYMIEIKKENTQMKRKQSELEYIIIELKTKMK